MEGQFEQNYFRMLKSTKNHEKQETGNTNQTQTIFVGCVTEVGGLRIDSNLKKMARIPTESGIMDRIFWNF